MFHLNHNFLLCIDSSPGLLCCYVQLAALNAEVGLDIYIYIYTSPMYMYMVIYTDMDLKPDTGSAAEVLSGLQPSAGQTQQSIATSNIGANC